MIALNRRIAVITGSSGGIGGATAIKLHNEGYGIIAHYNSGHDQASALQDHIVGKGGGTAGYSKLILQRRMV